MKKLICILLLLVFLVPVFAGGNKEITSEDGAVTTQHVSTSEKHKFVYNILTSVGHSLSKITAMVAMGLHPFPNIMAQFYDFSQTEDGVITPRTTYENEFESSYMVSSIGSQSDLEYNGKTAMQFGNGSVLVNGDTATQMKRWSITVYLFAAMLSAEIAFTAVMGYVAPQQEGMSLLKEIGAKTAKAFMLFILAASLPFLIEAVRWGLFEIAQSYSYNPEMSMTTMFSMPETFMQNTASVMEKLTITGSSDQITQHTSTGILGKIFMSIIILVFEFFLCMETIKAGLHIVNNIIEVYFLLAAVMILLPFSIFTPSKGLVGNCAQSLFMNLIECFIICLVIMLVIPACEKATKSLYTIISGTDGVVDRVVLNAKMNGDFADATDVSVNFQLEYITEQDLIVLASSWSSDKVLKHQDSSDETTRGRFFTIINGAGGSEDPFDVSEEYKAAYEEKGFTFVAASDLSCFWPDSDFSYNWYPSGAAYLPGASYCDMVCNDSIVRTMMTLSGSYLPESQEREADILWYMTIKDRASWRSNFAEDLRDGKDYVMMNNLVEEDSETQESNDRVLGRLLMVWILVWLPCFFVKQSSQITNGLRSGYVGMESFANAMSGAAGAMKAGGAMVMNGAKMIAGAANKGVAAHRAKNDSNTLQEIAKNTAALSLQKENNKDS